MELRGPLLANTDSFIAKNVICAPQFLNIEIVLNNVLNIVFVLNISFTFQAPIKATTSGVTPEIRGFNVLNTSPNTSITVATASIPFKIAPPHNFNNSVANFWHTEIPGLIASNIFANPFIALDKLFTKLGTAFSIVHLDNGSSTFL